MDESDAIITLSRGDAATAEQICRFLSENRRFEEVFSEYLAAAVALSGARLSAARDDVFEEQYQGLMAERAAELHGMLEEAARLRHGPVRQEPPRGPE